MRHSKGQWIEIELKERTKQEREKSIEKTEKNEKNEKNEKKTKNMKNPPKTKINWEKLRKKKKNWKKRKKVVWKLNNLVESKLKFKISKCDLY